MGFEDPNRVIVVVVRGRTAWLDDVGGPRVGPMLPDCAFGAATNVGSNIQIYYLLLII